MSKNKKADTLAAQARRVKHERFAYWFIKTGNAQGAARYAGYADGAHAQFNLMRHPQVQGILEDMIAKHRQEMGENLATNEEILKFLTQVMRGEIQVTGDRVSAAKELGKRLGIKKEIDKIIRTRKMWFNV